VQGVGACDRDFFNGDLAALKTLWGVTTDTSSNSSDAGNIDNAAGAP